MISYWTVTLFNIQETPITLIDILIFLIIIFLSFLIGFLIKRSIAKAFSFRKHSSSSSYAIGRLVYFAILIMGFYIAFTTLGINLTGIAVIGGALSVGIGFGLQAILNNFVSGILILLEKNVTPGDIIQLDSAVMGVVEKINIRSTVIETSDRKRIMIPNSEIISKKLTNWSLKKKGVYQVSIPFSVKREADKSKIKKIVLDLAKRSPLSYVEFSPSAHLVRLTEGLQDWELILWLNQKSQRLEEGFSFSHLADQIEKSMKEQKITLEKISCSTLFFCKQS